MSSHPIFSLQAQGQLRPLAQHAALHALLDDLPAYGLARAQINTHLPMAMGALAAIDASGDALAAWAAARRRATPAAEALSALPDMPDWRNAIGQQSAFPGLREYFLAQMRAHGVRNILLEVLHGMPFCPSGAAFHGLIRLAHGLDAQHLDECAAGLAWLVCAAWTPAATDEAPSGALFDDPASALAWLEAEIGALPCDPSSITRSLHAAGARPGLLARLPRLRSLQSDDEAVLAATLAAIAQCAIRAWLHAGGLTRLHLVTGGSALRRLLCHLPAAERKALLPAMLQAFWQAVCLAWLVAEPAQAMPQAQALAPADWPDILRAAARLQDVHDLKLAHACYAEAQAYGWPEYAQALAVLLQAMRIKTDAGG
ncbi:questin oxidase family protein [Massilia sp. W12]|uniref:questin oxidase family protein n=1 Tax=Massilia sp. W12 TaxID=3126507 RepID=UPI0030D2637C